MAVYETFEDAISQGEAYQQRIDDAITVLTLAMPYGDGANVMAIPVEANVLIESQDPKWAVKSFLPVKRRSKHWNPHVLMTFKSVAMSTIVVVIVVGYALVGIDGKTTGPEAFESVDSPDLSTTIDTDVASQSATANRADAATDESRQPAAADEIDEPVTTLEVSKWPDGIENLIFDYFSQLEGLQFVSINSVNCEPQICEIIFSGATPNPETVDDYSDVLNGLYRPPINAQTGSIGTREIAAGAREYVIRITNVPYVEPSREK